jgi:hypothetical protein
MDFSLSRVYVVPTDNTLPTSGTTADLTANQFGVFLPNYTPAISTTADDADYIFMAQGRPNDNLNLKSIKSEFVSAKNIISKYIVTGSSTVTQQITQVSAFQAKAGETYNITIRAFSDMLNTSYYNGLVAPFTVKSPCLDCGSDPCDSLTASQIQDLVDEFVTKINDYNALKGFIVASRTGTGADSVLVLTGQAQTGFTQNSDTTVNGYVMDAVTFDTWALVDAPTTQDLAVYDACNVFATVEITQNVSFPRGLAAQVKKVEQEWYAYTLPSFKTNYSDANFNLMKHSNVVDGTVYDTITLRVANSDNATMTFVDRVPEESTVIIFSPASKTAAIKAIIEAQVGTLVDKTPA